MEKSSGKSSVDDKDNVLYWVAPMNPAYRRDKPGKSPMGMDLIPVYENEYDEMFDGIPIVKIKPEIINNLGVRTITVKRETLWKIISTVGYIDYDETRISHIHTRTEGWIDKLKVRAEGEQVKRGQLLFELYSPPLVNAQEEYLQAVASGNRILSRASREKLSALGVSKSQIDRLQREKTVTQNISFYASQSGVLTNLGVREGMYVKPDTKILSLANLDNIWLLAEVFEKQANWVKVGQIAEAELTSMPGVIWKGNVEYIYPELNPVTRTLRVRLRFDNSEKKLMPNMYAHVTIFGKEQKDALSIPREALIRDAKQTRVIRALGDGRFQAQEVVAGIESGDWIEITSGLNEGDEIVVSSQFLIDSESNLKASLQRMQPIEGSMNDHSMEQSEMSK
ncbi:MAG: efflux RND transporter periplasmic adaptor subunit [Proteobacteria bacterium]|nr:efflux RND transporter periplasmic adaptor subunit [Pseudomonadota bacterium]